MSARVVLSGFEELRAELRDLPRHLAAEASGIVTGAANMAESEIRSTYAEHVRSGDLQKGLSSKTLTAGSYGAGVVVRSTSPHAWLFENGSQARHTAIGANRGAMPPAHVFIPAAIRARRAMYEQLRDLLQRNNFVVTGAA